MESTGEFKTAPISELIKSPNDPKIAVIVGHDNISDVNQNIRTAAQKGQKVVVIFDDFWSNDALVAYLQMNPDKQAIWAITGKSLDDPRNVERAKELMRTYGDRIIIANHTDTHPGPDTRDRMSTMDAQMDILAAQGKIKTYLGVEPKIFRAPGDWGQDPHSVWPNVAKYVGLDYIGVPGRFADNQTRKVVFQHAGSAQVQYEYADGEDEYGLNGGWRVLNRLSDSRIEIIDYPYSGGEEKRIIQKSDPEYSEFNRIMTTPAPMPTMRRLEDLPLHFGNIGEFIPSSVSVPSDALINNFIKDNRLDIALLVGGDTSGAASPKSYEFLLLPEGRKPLFEDYSGKVSVNGREIDVNVRVFWDGFEFLSKQGIGSSDIAIYDGHTYAEGTAIRGYSDYHATWIASAEDAKTARNFKLQLPEEKVLRYLNYGILSPRDVQGRASNGKISLAIEQFEIPEEAVYPGTQLIMFNSCTSVELLPDILSNRQGKPTIAIGTTKVIYGSPSTPIYLLGSLFKGVKRENLAERLNRYYYSRLPKEGLDIYRVR